MDGVGRVGRKKKKTKRKGLKTKERVSEQRREGPRR